MYEGMHEAKFLDNGKGSDFVNKFQESSVLSMFFFCLFEQVGSKRKVLMLDTTSKLELSD